MRFTLAQLNPIIGDFSGNVRKMTDTMKEAAAQNSRLLIFPELAASGYPPKDLLESPSFIRRYGEADAMLADASKEYPEMTICYGSIEATGLPTGKPLYNVARVIKNGRTRHVQRKGLLPTYDVFDEARYFEPHKNDQLTDIEGIHCGISICEDAWNAREVFENRLYDFDPVEAQGQAGAELFVNISASPYTLGKEVTRIALARAHAKRHNIPFVLVNQVGANDELISDGQSLVMNRDGELCCLLPAFEEAIVTLDTEALPPAISHQPGQRAAVAYRALVLGISDYMKKCGFKSVVLGLSGGVDSALTCCLAAEALGPENVHAVYMPSPYSADASGEDASALAANLGVRYDELSITDTFNAYKSMMTSLFEGRSEDVAEENFQARIRGNILMGLSNKFGHLCLSSGNKSELSVGYCTLYGDMSGGLAVLADVPKTLVYAICRYINRNKEIIPDRIITRAPSAELKPDQKDEDTLPPYDILDAILDDYLEKHLSIDDIVAKGYDRETVEWIVRTVQRNEYKRIQAAPGLKITSKAFGSGRRMPIAARYS